MVTRRRSGALMSGLCTGASGDGLAPPLEVGHALAVDAQAADAAEVDGAQRGDVGDGEAVAGDVLAIAELAIEPGHAAEHEVAHDRAELGRLGDAADPE